MPPEVCGGEENQKPFSPEQGEIPRSTILSPLKLTYLFSHMPSRLPT